MSRPPASGTLRQSLGLTHATAMVIGTIIGASIFVQPSEITRQMPSVSGIILVWLAAGVLTLFGALVCAELASAFPRTGGVYVFLKEAWSPAVGFLWGWAMFWSMHTGIIAAIAMVFARYAAVLLAPIVAVGDAGIRGIAVGVIVTLSAVNYTGVRQGGFVQNLFTGAKLVAILAIIVAGLAWAGPAPAAAADTLRAIGPRGFVLALAAGLFAYGGWHMVTYTAGETRDAATAIPRALVIGTLVVTACYAGLNAIYLRVLPLDAVRTSTHVAADAADRLLGGGGASLMAVLVMVSTFGAVNGIILVGPRVYYSMAQDGLLFRWLGQVHPRFKTPHRALAIQAAWASILALTNTYGALFTRVIYTEWIFFAVMAVGLMRLRQRRDYMPAYRVWGYPLVPLVFVAASAVVVIMQVIAVPRDSVLGLGMVLLGLPVYPSLVTKMIIDFHSHYYPPEYLDALGPSGSILRITIDDQGNPVVHYPGDYNVMVRGHRDIAYRQGVLDDLHVDTQVISLTTPGTHVETPAVAAKLAAITNDAFARVHAERPRRFIPLATLPLCDPKASVAEFVRAMDQLRMPGAMLFSNVNGTGLDDARFWPIYEAANERAAVMMIHPTYPVGVEAMQEYWLMPLNGFLFDTTLAASKLVFSGVAKRYPRIKWVLGHLGGTIPYLAERLDRGWRAFKECRAHIDEPPTTYLKKHFYYDTVNFAAGPLKLAIEFAGADHILAGSDYPHMIGSIPLMLEAIRGLPVSDEDKAGILGGNAARILARS